MKESPLKTIIRRVLFPPGAIRTIQWGPLRGQQFRVGPVTGLSPWYSGVERRHQQIFKALVRPGDVVVDVGANWGLHTLYLSKLVGNGGRVIALEPYARVFEELEWHLQANNCLNVTPLAAAASDRCGSAAFIVAKASSQGAISEVFHNPDPLNAITVPTKTLDVLIAELRLDRLRMVKIDVEGAESKVLAGAEQAMRALRPYFLIDLHTPEQDVAVATILVKHGYRLDRLTGPPIVRTDFGWPHRDGVWGTILASQANTLPSTRNRVKT